MDDIVETKTEVSQQLDAAAASLAKDDMSEFDENPQWLLEDIRELKHLERLKLIKAVSEKAEVLRPKSSKKSVACDYEQLPDVLVHSKAEAVRGRSTKHNVSCIKKSASSANLIINISREEATQRNLDALHTRDLERRIRHGAILQRMSSTAALPKASTRYLERRQLLSQSPLRGTAAFRTHETVPRPQTAPNRGRASHVPEREAFLVTKSDSNRNMTDSRKKSPSPDKYRNPDEEKRQRMKILQTVIVGWWYAKNLKINMDLKRDVMAKREAASIVLQQRLRRLMKGRKDGRVQAAAIVPACLRRAIIRYRRRKYIGIVKSYLIECAKNQKSKIIRQFLYRVRRLQRLIKNWLVTQRARTDILKRYWDRVEFNYRMNLANEYRDAQELLIETERRLKKRARAPIAELWAKTNTKVLYLLKKAEKVQLQAAREKAFEDKTEMPYVSNGGLNAISLGDFEGKISEEERMKVIREIIKSKRGIFLHLKQVEKIAATQALSSKTKVNEELVRRLLTNYRSYSSHVVRVQLVTMREVARQQRDRFTRAQNVCFLTNPNLGPMFKTVIEGIVWKDIQDKKSAAAEAEAAAKSNRMQRLNTPAANGNPRGGILKKSLSGLSLGPESDLIDGGNSINSADSQSVTKAKKNANKPKRKKSVRIQKLDTTFESNDDDDHFLLLDRDL